MVTGKKELHILIRPDGSVFVDVQGVKGKSCVDLIEFLESALRGETRRKLKPDYYERETFIHSDVKRKD